jgi:hypothetical protein
MNLMHTSADALPRHPCHNPVDPDRYGVVTARQLEGFIAFDSAWTDNPKAPGAICAAVMKNGEALRFDAPRLTAFDGALCASSEVATPTAEKALVALDQPTIVPNLTSMRPVEARGRLARQLTRRRRAAVESRATWDVLRRLRHAADGTQQNDCRDLVLAYLRGPTIARG